MNKANKYEDFKIEDFKDEDYFLDEVISKIYDLRKDESIAVVGKIKFIGFVFKELIREGLGCGCVKFDGFDEADYQDEYILQVFAGSNDVSVKPLRYEFKGKDRFSTLMDTYTYLFQEDIEQDIVDNSLCHSKYPILFGLDSNNT